MYNAVPVSMLVLLLSRSETKTQSNKGVSIRSLVISYCPGVQYFFQPSFTASLAKYLKGGNRLNHKEIVVVGCTYFNRCLISIFDKGGTVEGLKVEVLW